MLWDVFLYAVNMCCSRWLINKVALAWQDKMNPGGKSKQRYRKRMESEMPAAAQGAKCQSIPGNTTAMWQYTE